MLKRLELVGFKSFAEKTEFAFAPGVTAVVGPNGSGKSNIIDAVRWVMGEQSAKSLRGGEMTDVIFNGSASRRSLGLAEVSMIFDNSRRQLASEANEVQITRRVYRSGEGEYLINQRQCRLKDIKDLFLGSGAGAGAYAIIEQGRVDVLLQASTRERRIIFEEAAGISRFKAKKIETLRRLERVEQNLTRLRDILEEIEKQLRSVKLQAAKAQRYQEYSEQLQRLRITLGLQEYHQLTDALNQQSRALDQLRSTLQAQASEGEACASELHKLEAALGQRDEIIHQQEIELSGAREQIATLETTLGHEHASVLDVERDLVNARETLARSTLQLAQLTDLHRQMEEEVQQAEEAWLQQQQTVAGLEHELQGSEKQLVALAEQGERDKTEHLERMRQSAHLQNDVVSYAAQVQNLQREQHRLRQRSEQAAEHLASIDGELQQLEQAEGALQQRLTDAKETLGQLRQERDHFDHQREQTTHQAAELRAGRSGLRSRIEVLEGLERSHEGMGTGVREVFAHLENEDPGPWKTVMGIFADFVTVRRDFAPLIDLVLGERAQRFLVRDVEQLGKAMRQRGRPFSGRVSFLPVTERKTKSGHPQAISKTGEPRGGLAPPSPPGAEGALATRPARPTPWDVDDKESSPSFPGIVARAEQVVRCEDPSLADLPARLLQNTLIVRDLPAGLAVQTKFPGYRCITLNGELLEPDGALTVGTHHAEAGILSRKSELRESREEVAQLDERITQTEEELTSLRERIARYDHRMEQTQREIDVLTEQLADLRFRLSEHRQRREGLHEEVTVNQSEISGLEQEIDKLQFAWEQAREQAAQAEAEVQAIQARLQELAETSRQLESCRQQQQQGVLAARVSLAQGEERLSALRTRQQRTDADLRQRTEEHARTTEHITQMSRRLAESQRVLLEAESSLAGWYLRKESAERQLTSVRQQRTQLVQLRQEKAERAQQTRSAWQEQQEEVHTYELEVNNLRNRRDTLTTRLQEDYQLNLAVLYEQWQGTAEEHEAEESALPDNFDQPEGEVEPPPPETQESTPEEDQALPLPARDADWLDPDAANEEIADLRKKLNRLGSVNMDALQELAELEARHGTLQIQYEDLSAAQRSLQEIIAKINTDSKRLFLETFTTIRAHFQELFRKLFGGGLADIHLEDEEDVLECGIEIMARPPGKELRSISLMSGGERTLTAVALLLGIFRSKPSPFCLLDEVDAALDEANIGRFTSVLREFLELSQFIIITHSKRTMTCADVLYGVTMQESGVSTRIAVRFEDWPDESADSESAA